MSSWINGNLKGSLSVGQGERGKSLEYMWRGTELGIRQEGEEEYQFVDLAGSGAGSGREIELQVGNGFIQWRHKGEDTWNNLISIDSLKGPKGDKGESGRDGSNGVDGKDGVTPNIQIGTVTTLEAGKQATVTKRGTDAEPIFDFAIPKGEKGNDGADGITPDMTEFEKKINEQYENIKKKVEDHITNHPQGGSGANIDDATISAEKTWSSAKIEDFVHTNDDVVWTTVQGENLSVDYTKEGYLREVEIWGNTIQYENNLEDIQHLGELYVDSEGQPILDELGREQYKVEVGSCNKNLFDIDVLKPVDTNNISTFKDNVITLKGNKRFDCITYTISVIPNQKYYISMNWDSNVIVSVEKCFQISDKSGLLLRTTTSARVGTLSKGFFTTTANSIELTIYGCGDAREFITTISNIFITTNVEMNYIPHQSHKTTLLLPCQLSKVGDVADRLFWDDVKKKYVVEKNIKDFKKGEKYSKIVIANHQSTQTHQGFDIHLFDKVKFQSAKWIISSNKVMPKSTYENYVLIGLYEGNPTNIEVIEQHLKTVNNIYYILDTPQLIETNITEQITLPCYKDKTHLFVTGGLDGTIKAKIPLDGGQAIQSLSARNIALNEEITTLSLENKELKQMDNEMVATTWDMDFRMCELEWTLEDLGIGQEVTAISLGNNIKNMKGSVSNMALTRYEQAKIMIVGGVYKKETLTKQLTTYLNRGYLKQEEYDELIALMEAKELVTEE